MAKKNKTKCDIKCEHGGNAVYGLGLIGAIVYYISTATGFWNGVWGILKALVWPAFLVYALLKDLGV
jgi:hypothetical protein